MVQAASAELLAHVTRVANPGTFSNRNVPESRPQISPIPPTRSIYLRQAPSGPLSAGGKSTVGARAIFTGSLSAAEDLAAWVVDGHRSAGSQAGSPIG